jgi:hypothetical protein
VQVRGFADRNLRDKQHPEDASNRRISVIVRYQQATEAEPDPVSANPAEPVRR